MTRRPRRSQDRRGFSLRADASGEECADGNYLQTWTLGRIVFSRKIDVASAVSIRTHAKAYGGPTPPAVLDHEGIDNGFLGKASMIYYFFCDTWLELQGAD